MHRRDEMSNIPLIPLPGPRAHEFIYTTTGYLHPRVTKMSQYMARPSRSEEKAESVRLDGLRLIPYFTGQRYGSDEQARAHLSHNLDSLRILTPLARERYCSRLCNFVDEFLEADNPLDDAAEYLPSIKAFMLQSSRRQLQAVPNDVARPLGSSFWSSIAPAGSMYVNNVAADLPANDCDAYAQLYLRLIRDIDSTELTMKGEVDGHEIWLWKVFTGAYTIAKTQLAVEEASGRPEDESSTFRTLRLWFGQRIHSWSQTAQVTDWKDAEKVLSTVCWPKDSPGAGLSENLWQEAVWGNRNTQRFNVETLLIH